MQASRVLELRPRGACAGVEMAVRALAWLVVATGGPVYCFHEVVHNQRVVERFRRLGVRFVDDVGEVPDAAPLLLSAHGSDPRVRQTARRRSGVTVDAVCPLVAKVHGEIRRRAAAGDQVVYVGHRGHDEAMAATAVAPDRTTLVPEPAALPDVPAGTRVAVLAQTTLAVDDWADVLAAARARYGEVWTPPREDICYATTNRQAAVRAAAGACDAFVVVGSASSANTAALVRVARSAGCATVLRVDGAAELPAGRYGTVGVSAGASAPEDAIVEVVGALGGVVEPVVVVDEDESFPLPPELRALLPAAWLAADRHLGVAGLLRLAEQAQPPTGLAG